jgi:hypothetical protein
VIKQLVILAIVSALSLCHAVRTAEAESINKQYPVTLTLITHPSR